MRPTLFLVVDGVLNAERRYINQRKKAARVTGWTDWEFLDVTDDEGREWPFSLSRQMGEALAALPVDIVWATSWVEHPKALNRIAALVGLPTDLPTVYPPLVESSWPESSGKNRAVGLYMLGVDQSYPKVVWVDDELGNNDYIEASDWNVKMVRTETIWGLRRSQLDEITEFLK